MNPTPFLLLLLLLVIVVWVFSKDSSTSYVDTFNIKLEFLSFLCPRMVWPPFPIVWGPVSINRTGSGFHLINGDLRGGEVFLWLWLSCFYLGGQVKPTSSHKRVPTAFLLRILQGWCQLWGLTLRPWNLYLSTQDVSSYMPSRHALPAPGRAPEPFDLNIFIWNVLMCATELVLFPVTRNFLPAAL